MTKRAAEKFSPYAWRKSRILETFKTLCRPGQECGAKQ
jgi:hypothetical protein